MQQQDDLSHRVHCDVAMFHSALKRGEGEWSAQVARQSRFHDGDGLNGRGLADNGRIDAATCHVESTIFVTATVHSQSDQFGRVERARMLRDVTFQLVKSLTE